MLPLAQCKMKPFIQQWSPATPHKNVNVRFGCPSDRSR